MSAVERRESRALTPTLGDGYADGYAAGVADARDGMPLYVSADLAGEDYAAGYDAGVKDGAP